MKRLFTLLAPLSMTVVMFSQSPEKMSYQAVVRNAEGALIINSDVGIRIQILQNSEFGAAIYVETHSAITNDNGLITIEIGEGTGITGSFASIDWSAGPYFLQTEIDPTGGTDYSISGVSKILSVPYALHAKTAESILGTITETDPLFTGSQAANITALDITNLGNLSGTNTGDQDLSGFATTGYVDDLIVRIEELELVANGFTDPRDGNHYNAVKIGNQMWMTKNLKYLPAIVGPDTGSLTAPYYYVYGYDGTNVNDAKATANYGTYGVLYNWTAAMNSAGSSTSNPSEVQGICPTGWHLPSDAEWTELIDNLGGKSIAGDKLKEIGTSHWSSPNTGATNETRFTALPGGMRYLDGAFLAIGTHGNYWSAAESGSNFAWYWGMVYNFSGVYRDGIVKELGFSVRCVKD